MPQFKKRENIKVNYDVFIRNLIGLKECKTNNLFTFKMPSADKQILNLSSFGKENDENENDMTQKEQNYTVTLNVVLRVSRPPFPGA